MAESADEEISFTDLQGKRNPADALTYYNRGNEFYEKEDYDKAIENYNMAIILNPRFAEAYFARALAYYNKKEYEQAIADYTRAAEIDPRNATIYNNRGDCYYRLQDYDKAMADYDKAVKLNKRYLKAYYNKGLCHALKEEYEKAIEDFSKVIELNPNFADGYHVRAMAYEQIGDFDRALADYDKAIELDPNFTEAIQHRAQCLQKKESGGVTQQGEQKEGGPINAEKLLSKPKSSFADVAGMEETKERLREAIVYPLQDPDLARRYGQLGGGGILLYGPPGCGKTYIVKAAAGEAAAAFMNVKLSDVLDMYVGNTEKNIHACFEVARKHAPCIVFIDEIEGLAGRRDQPNIQQHQRQAVNQILYEMDGIDSRNENVLVIGATNAPWDMDPALRRAGRFSNIIYIPEPDQKSREQIFRIQVKLLNLDVEKNINYGRLARATEGYASADITEIVREAARIPWKEALKGKPRKVRMGDFLTAIRKRKSSLGPWYEGAKKQIGEQEEVWKVDGKKQVKTSPPKMGPGERQQFEKLVKSIERNNKWYVKLWISIKRFIALYII